MNKRQIAIRFEDQEIKRLIAVSKKNPSYIEKSFSELVRMAVDFGIDHMERETARRGKS